MKKEIKSLLKKNLSLKKIYINGDHYHLKVIAVGKIFINKNSFQRQKIIYAELTNFFKENMIHAITINPYTKEEWKKKKKNHFS